MANNPFRKMYFNNTNPYIYTSSTFSIPLKKWHSVNGPENDATVSGKSNLGAAFNYNLLIHDRGGVVHNRFYTRRLIYDAIDWLDDNKMNYSVGTTLSALSGTGNTNFKADAITYLINAGTNNVNIGTLAERF
jgi:hypothetical protein